MAKFCGKCGARLDKATGLCPNCNADKLNKQIKKPESAEIPKPKPKQDTVPKLEKPLSKKEAKKKRKAEKKTAKKEKKKEQRVEKKAAKKEKRAQWSTGKKLRRFFLKLLMCCVLIVVIGSVMVGGLSYYNIIDVPIVDEILVFIGLKYETVGGVEEYKVDAPNAEEYYNKNSNIVSEIDANDSTEVLTEKEACAELIGRGFKDYPTTTEYTMDGTYSEAVDISNSSSDKHPIYQTYYFSASGDLWGIFIINGTVLANPVSYNLQSSLGAQLIVSETDTIMSYDSTTNKFYETIPNESVLIVVCVNEINAETLDSLTIGEIDRHV